MMSLTSSSSSSLSSSSPNISQSTCGLICICGLRHPLKYILLGLLIPFIVGLSELNTFEANERLSSNVTTNNPFSNNIPHSSSHTYNRTMFSIITTTTTITNIKELSKSTSESFKHDTSIKQNLLNGISSTTPIQTNIEKTTTEIKISTPLVQNANNNKILEFASNSSKKEAYIPSTYTDLMANNNGVPLLKRMSLIALKSDALIEQPLIEQKNLTLIETTTITPIILTPITNKLMENLKPQRMSMNSNERLSNFVSSVYTHTNIDQNVVSVSKEENKNMNWLLSQSSENKLNTENKLNHLPPFDEEQQAVADLLTKGFSIPTFLPPFPVFDVVDLSAYLNSVSSTTITVTTNVTPTTIYFSEVLHKNSPELHLTLNNLLSQQRTTTTNRNSNLVGNETSILVQTGNHAYLPCKLDDLKNKPVSWIRVRDGHIITVAQSTFIADQRFQAIHQHDDDMRWSLQIKYVQPNDEGWYECQVSVEPKISAKVFLKIIVPLTELIGDQSRFVKAGSKVALHCIVRGTLDPPQYIIWYRDKTQIGDNNKMGWYTQLDRNIFGNNDSNQNTIGSLIIPSVRKNDSGNYTCQPSNSASVSVDLHVLSGEYSASAIMSSAMRQYYNDYMSSLIIVIITLKLSIKA